nr:hypothetical protein [uncultured Draconibacterium sp.]
MEKQLKNLRNSLIITILGFVVISGVIIYSFYDEIQLLKNQNQALVEKINEVDLSNQLALNRLFDKDSLFIPKLKCQNFEIVDHTKSSRMKFLIKENELWQQFFDNEKKMRIAIGITSDGSNKIRLYDELGNPRWVTTVTKKNIEKPFFVTATFKENEEIQSLFGTVNLNPQIAFYNRKKIVFTGGYDNDSNSSFFELFNNNNQKYRLRCGENELHQMFVDKYGQYRLGQGITNSQLSYFEQIKSGSETNFKLTTDANGNFNAYSYKTPSDRLFKGASLFSTAKTFYDLIFK